MRSYIDDDVIIKYQISLNFNRYLLLSPLSKFGENNPCWIGLFKAK